MSNTDFEQHFRNCKRFAQFLRENQDRIIEALSGYEPYDVAKDEIELACSCLEQLDKYEASFGGQVESISAFMPTNVPIYYYTVLGAVPSSMAPQVNLRPNQIMQDGGVFDRLSEIIPFQEFFPNVHIRQVGRDEFNREYVSSSDAVVFTGTPGNAAKIIDQMKEGALLAVNGAGHNPLVITDTADIEKAVTDSVYLKGYNGGQECTAPDAILVHKSVADEFIRKYTERYTALKTGPCSDPDVRVGPISRLTELRRFGDIMHANRENVVAGGKIDFTNGIVEPTVIASDIEKSPNYQEIFGPISFIHVYEKDEDLAKYFEHPSGRYDGNKMYVSMYGNSAYVEARDDSRLPEKNGIGIVLRESTIHDQLREDGNAPFGGYSAGASCVMMRNARTVHTEAKPIFIPEVIKEHVIDGVPIRDSRKKRVEHAAGARDSLGEEFKAIVGDVFGEDLAFAFISGNTDKPDTAAGRVAAGKPPLLPLVCLHEAPTKEAFQAFSQRFSSLLRKKGFSPPDQANIQAGVVTFGDLERQLSTISDISLDIKEKVPDEVKLAVRLNDEKSGFTGNGRLMSGVIRPTVGALSRWKGELVSQWKHSPSSAHQSLHEATSRKPPLQVLKAHMDSSSISMER